MGFSIGLVGLPNAGKSTIFNALSHANAQTANYAFTTVEPNKALVNVPDERLQKIAGIIKPPKVTQTTLECIDIAGLVEGASRGEGLGNKFLENIRQVDCVAHVIRCFEDENIPGDYAVDPKKDLSLIETELLLSDLEIVTKRLLKASKALRIGEKRVKNEVDFLENLRSVLEKGFFASDLSPKKDDERFILKEMNLLTSKPSIYIGNLKEGKEKELIEKAKMLAIKRLSNLILIDGLIEAELKESSKQEKLEILKEYGYEDTGLNNLLKEGYKKLDLITFYTIKGDETRAWSLKRGQSALEAASKIHSDIARGFIKADVANFKDFEKHQSFEAVSKAGALTVAGKDYIVQDGDMILFKFKV